MSLSASSQTCRVADTALTTVGLLLALEPPGASPGQGASQAAMPGPALLPAALGAVCHHCPVTSEPCPVGPLLLPKHPQTLASCPTGK